MSSFQDRMIRAAKLDVALYEEVEADKGAMGQAMAVVILSSLAAGIGTIGEAGVTGILIGTIITLVAWLIWSYLTYAIGTKILSTPETSIQIPATRKTIPASPGMMARTLIRPGELEKPIVRNNSP